MAGYPVWVVVENDDAHIKESLMIKMEGIKKTYKIGDIEVHALQGLRCEVKKGEMVAVMGPAGAVLLPI